MFATGAKLAAVNVCRPFSVRLRCRKKRHLEGGKMLITSKSDELCLGVTLCVLEFELPEDLRNFRELFLACFVSEPCLDTDRAGELLSLQWVFRWTVPRALP